MRLWHEEHGAGAPVLLLLHGLGATAEVWRGVCDLAAGGWPGTRMLVDLAGHGRSEPLAGGYSYQAHAAALRDLLRGRGPVVVAGHSMGGHLGILLAAERHGLEVAGVVGLGIKVRWSKEETEALRRRAGHEPRWFASREEAAARYARSVGLEGIVAADDPVVASGLLGAGGRWRLAVDPAANGVGPPDVAAALATARAPVTLARGAGDPLVSGVDLAELQGARVRELPGLGHNAHVEDPAAVWELVAAACREAGAL